MFITEEQALERLSNPRNLANRFRKGREIYATDEVHEASIEERENLHQESIQHREIKRPGNNRPWLSKQDRTRIAADVTAATIYGDKTRTEIAKTYGVAISTVSDIANNARRVPNTERSVEQAKIDAALDDVREKAIDRLMSGLGLLTEDKISTHNAKDISTVCSNMAKVIKQTIPQENAAQAINLIVYTPELRKESNFDIIEVE